jgi:hypothetical protein
MITTLTILFMLTRAFSQISATVGNTTLTLTSGATLSLDQDPNSPSYPNDFYRRIQISNTNIYALGSNNIVDIYKKADPTQKVQLFSNYSYGSHLPYTMIDIAINSAESTMVLSSYFNSILQHLAFGLNSTGVTALKNISGDHSFSTSPFQVFLKDGEVYTYFREASGNDSFYIVNLIDNSSKTITLGVSNCQIAVSPNKQNALIWDKRSNLYIYSLPSLALVYTYTLSANSPATRTDMISFSSDSRMAILESDNLNPVRVINLTDFSTIANITVHGTIQSSTFLDPLNRFILIVASSGNIIYDLKTSTQGSLSKSFSPSSISVDSSVS